MKVKLLRQNRIEGMAGKIVDVSPARAAFLFEYGLAEPAEIRETPEANLMAGIEVPEVCLKTGIETPEKTVKGAKSTRKKA